MTTLIVYYSLSGNTELIANEISQTIESDVLCIHPTKSMKEGKFSTYFWGGMSAKMERKPKLEDYHVDFEKYDLVLLGSPVWAWTLAPPMRSFVNKEKEKLKPKRIGLFMSAGGDGIKAMKRFKNYMEEFNIVSQIILQEPKTIRTEEQKAQIRQWATEIVQK